MAKPAFDPNQPFELPKKPAFDPNAAFEVAQPATPNVLDVAAQAGVETAADYGRDILDTAAGVVQGATLGGADELEAAARTIPELVTNFNEYKNPEEVDPAKYFAAQDAQTLGKAKENPYSNKNDKLEKLYRQYQQLSEKKYDDASERSPWLYGAGQIAGGVAAAPLMGSAGLMATAETTALKEALKQGGKAAIAKEAGKVIATDAALSAPAAAAYGSLASESDIIGASPEEQAKNLSEAATSAEFGGLFAGGLNLASAGIPAAYNALKNKLASSPDGATTRFIKQAYEAGKKGINISDEATQAKMFREPGKFADELIGTFHKADEHYGKEIGRVIDDATQKGVKVNVDPSITEANRSLGKALRDNPSLELDPKTQKIVDRITAGDAVELTPNEARSVAQDMTKIIQQMEGDTSLNTNTLRNLASNFKRSVTAALNEAVPEYKTAASNFAKFRERTFDQVLSKSTPSEKTGIKYGQTKNRDLKVRDEIESLIQTATRPGAGGKGHDKAAFDLIQEKLLDLEKTNPEAFEKMGTSAKNLIGKMKNKADEASMFLKAAQQDPRSNVPTTPHGLLSGIHGTTDAMTIKAANMVGRNVKPIQNAISAPARVTKKVLFETPLNALDSVANQLKMSGNEQASKYADNLLRAIANKDQVAKNATLFAIMQNPKLKQILNIETDEDNK